MLRQSKRGCNTTTLTTTNNNIHGLRNGDDTTKERHHCFQSARNLCWIAIAQPTSQRKIRSIVATVLLLGFGLYFLSLGILLFRLNEHLTGTGRTSGRSRHLFGEDVLSSLLLFRRSPTSLHIGQQPSTQPSLRLVGYQLEFNGTKRNTIATSHITQSSNATNHSNFKVPRDPRKVDYEAPVLPSSSDYRENAKYPYESWNGCVPMYEWQTSTYPSCNTAHEIDMYPSKQNFVFINCGSSRCAFMIRDGDEERVVLKTQKYVRARKRVLCDLLRFFFCGE